MNSILVQRTANPLLPASYATGVSLVAAIGVLFTNETAFQLLDVDERGAGR